MSYCLMLLYCLQVDPGYLSEPSAVEFKTEGGLTAFMNYYPPKNKVCNTENPFSRFCDCCALLFAISRRCGVANGVHCASTYMHARAASIHQQPRPTQVCLYSPAPVAAAGFQGSSGQAAAAACEDSRRSHQPGFNCVQPGHAVLD